MHNCASEETLSYLVCKNVLIGQTFLTASVFYRQPFKKYCIKKMKQQLVKISNKMLNILHPNVSQLQLNHVS